MKLFIGLVAICALVAAALAYVHYGMFNVAADEPHSALVTAVMDTVRSRSIAVRARDIQVPALDDQKLIATGAQHYAQMCVACHLAPGTSDSELRAGLYPQPPDLSKHMHPRPAETFWIVKHGIKMSGMPAWGATHDDASIWGLVAFLKILPDLEPARYQAIISKEGGPRERHHQGSHPHNAATEKAARANEAPKKSMEHEAMTKENPAAHKDHSR